MIKVCEVCGNRMKVFAKGDSYTYWKCAGCHWYSTSANFTERTFDYDDYETFDADLTNKDALVIEAKRILKYKFNLLNLKPRNFLDVGCSEGIFVKAYDELMHSAEGYGIEVAKPKIQRARDEGLKVYSFEDMPKKKFDFIFCRHVIEHIDKPMEYLHKILEYIGEEGVLCIETPNNENWDNLRNGNSIREDRFCRDLYPPTHVCGFAPKTFKIIGRNLNLEMIKLLTHNVSNLDWCYSLGEGEEKTSLKNRFIEKIYLGGNIAVFYHVCK